MTSPTLSQDTLAALKYRMKDWARELGFSAIGVSGTDLEKAETRLLDWLTDGCHGEMSYMERHGSRRSNPAELHPGTIRVVSVRVDYLPETASPEPVVLNDRSTGYVARYALGRDYHRVIRRKLQKLANLMTADVGPFQYRAFTDSAPVMEKPIAMQAGLGWIGKHTNLIDQSSGSFFLLGELYTDLPLPVDSRQEDHCGDCSKCMSACPTGAIDRAYHLDARRCISYLTIELHGPIPIELRSLIGNRVFGCDDCQLVCPWNRFAQRVSNPDFQPRHGLDASALTDLFNWSETEFLTRLEGSPIRRIGYQRWLRNIAVALGNGPPGKEAILALEQKRGQASVMVGEHIDWALEQLICRQKTNDSPVRC